ncbi:MAG: AAA family ATPase [Bacillota bacterium]|nr:AAA family ATPase [Bacillota bacterium]
MIQSLYIDNFKAFNDFHIEMKPLTVLIGANASGKTSILQALDLIANFAQMDIDAYLEKRKWKPSELKSKGSKKFNMTFRLQLELEVDQSSKLIEWEFVLNNAKEKISVVSEKIVDKTIQKTLLSVQSNGISRFNFQEHSEEKFPALNMKSSFLKNIDVKDKEKFPELVALIDFLTASDSFELLSPEKMRQTSRGDVDTIGMGGEKLAAFIHRLQPEQRENVSERLQRYVPFVDEVDAEVKGRPGWLEIKVSERFPSEEKNVVISPAHVSDGTLRMLAIAALIEIDC